MTPSPGRILFLEDNAADADLARRAIVDDAPQARIELYTTLAAARARLEAGGEPIDVILSDLRLPDGSGLELLAHVRERALPIAVVMLTGSGDQASALTALQSGADDYVAKRGDYCGRLARVLAAAVERFRGAADRKPQALRVLYAEHSDFDIDLTRRHFAAHAPLLQLDVVHGGEAVLQRLAADAADRPGCDLVLLDYQLPGMNALEVAKVLREDRHLDIPIVLVTGQGDEELVAAALRIGIDDYVVKHEGYLFSLPPIIENAIRHAQLRREQSALRETSARLRQLLSASPTVLYALREDGASSSPVWVSDNVMRILGYPPEQCVRPQWWLSCVDERDRERVLRERQDLAAQGGLSQTYRMRGGGGETLWVRDELRLIGSGEVDRGEIIGTWTDVSSEHEALAMQRLQSTALESTRDAIMITDLEPRIISVNRAFTEINGYRAEEALGRNPSFMRSGRQDRGFYLTLWASLKQAGHWQGEIWNRRADGEVLPQWMTISAVRDEGGMVTHYVAVSTDLSKLRKSEEELDRLSHFDPLTRLPNRLLLGSLIRHGIEHARRQEASLAVLVIDLDQFKNINDSLGHVFGDELLVAVANRLKSRLRHEDTLGRLGADEFMVVLDAGGDPSGVEIVARELLAALDAPFALADGHQTYVRASIGISVFPEDGASAGDLLRFADAAMHRAKCAGGNQIAFYTRELERSALDRLERENALRDAIGRGELLLHYQPKLALASGAIVAAEALVRWLRPGVGLVAPGDFIPLAESTGLIVEIGNWVIEEVARQLRAWIDAGQPVVRVAVNVSARQFAVGDLAAVIEAALARHRIDPALVDVEVTESMLMADPEEAIARLSTLKRIGVGISLDDFGTGYSSLAYLSRFPVDELKIDRSFVSGITRDPKSAGIATSVIAMAHRMGLSVVAEGVETDLQLGYLRKNRCDQMQGFLFSRPLPAEDFARLVEQGKALPPAADPAIARTLLVVDDEPNICAAMRRLLRGQGYRVLTAGSAREGLDLLASNPVQVILSDQRMPEMSGTEFLALVKQMHPDTVRIVLSGFTELESIIAAVNEGAIYKFLTKPWDDDQLRGHIRDAFDYHDAIIKPRASGEAVPT